MEKFYAAYRGEKTIVGRSVLGNPVFALHCGHGYPVGIIQAGMHAREWIAAYLVMEQVRLGLRRGSAWFLPLTNPDGALLSACGIGSVTEEVRRKFLLGANGGEDFSRWKANAAAVDLNVNFDARWGEGLYNVRFPAPANYVGPAPFSEPESRALRDFTLSVRPQYTISYHTMGGEIYWHFRQPFLRGLRDKRLACLLSSLTGYPLKEAAGSVGGYKDWCVRALKIPAFTVEVGEGEHPLGFAALDGILGHNLCSVRAFSARWSERRGCFPFF